MAELRQTFRPEFLNRIDDIIVFRALTEQDIEEVARRMLKTVAGRMEAMEQGGGRRGREDAGRYTQDRRYRKAGRGGRQAGCHQVIIPWKFLIHT